MSLDDIYYFSVKKVQHPELFNFANSIVKDCEKNKVDNDEIIRRMALLQKTSGAEHVRQCSNFLAELATFKLLLEEGSNPHWVPESSKKMPDIQCSTKPIVPVEVKHLNSPREEHEALFHGKVYGGSVNKNYDFGLRKKIADFIEDAEQKFESFNENINGARAKNGRLYIFFSKSIDAGIVDGIKWEEKMEHRIRKIAESILPHGISLVVTDIDLIV